jgi:TonB family protein
LNNVSSSVGFRHELHDPQNGRLSRKLNIGMSKPVRTNRSLARRFCFLSLIGCLLLEAACSSPFSRLTTKQYRCEVAGKPEPKTAREYLQRGQIHTDAGELDCALAACAEVIRLAPKEGVSYACRGNVLRLKNDYDGAVKDYTEGLRLSPNDAGLHFNRGLLYKEKGDNDLAIEDFSNAIRLRPDFAYYYHFRGGRYFEKGDYQRDVADETEAIRLDPKNIYFYRDRASAYRKLGQSELAEADQAKADLISTSEHADSKQPSPSPKTNPTSSRAPITGGELNGKAISLPKPEYPPVARKAHASGSVRVKVVVDENGDVTSAVAVSGHALLHAAATYAAYQAKFVPAKLSGQPVKVSGVLIYNFAE